MFDMVVENPPRFAIMVANRRVGGVSAVPAVGVRFP